MSTLESKYWPRWRVPCRKTIGVYGGRSDGLRCVRSPTGVRDSHASTLNIDLLAPSRPQTAAVANPSSTNPVSVDCCNVQAETRPSDVVDADFKREPGGYLYSEQPDAIRELSNFRRGPLHGSGEHIREEQAQPLSHCRVRKRRISKPRI